MVLLALLIPPLSKEKRIQATRQVKGTTSCCLQQQQCNGEQDKRDCPHNDTHNTGLVSSRDFAKTETLPDRVYSFEENSSVHGQVSVMRWNPRLSKIGRLVGSASTIR